MKPNRIEEGKLVKIVSGYYSRDTDISLNVGDVGILLECDMAVPCAYVRFFKGVTRFVFLDTIEEL